jgi:hypothetical protein
VAHLSEEDATTSLDLTSSSCSFVHLVPVLLLGSSTGPTVDDRRSGELMNRSSSLSTPVTNQLPHILYDLSVLSGCSCNSGNHVKDDSVALAHRYVVYSRYKLNQFVPAI